MDYNKLIEYRAKIRDKMDSMLEDDDFELSIKYLTYIHESLFKGILFFGTLIEYLIGTLKFCLIYILNSSI